jgi:hypothetical protein
MLWVHVEQGESNVLTGVHQRDGVSESEGIEMLKHVDRQFQDLGCLREPSLPS